MAKLNMVEHEVTVSLHDAVGKIQRCPPAEDVLAESLPDELRIGHENGQQSAKAQRINGSVTSGEVAERFVRRLVVDE